MTVQTPQLLWTFEAAGQAHIVKADLILPDAQVIQLRVLVHLSEHATVRQMKAQALQQVQGHIQRILQSIDPPAAAPPSAP